MEAIRITEQTIPAIHQKIGLTLGSKDSYEVVIRKHDASLKSRQRALCHIWYKEIAEHYGCTVGHAIARCKYYQGFRILTRDNPMMREMIKRMIGSYPENIRLEIIETYPSFFPLLSDKDGLCSEGIAEYLTEIQRFWLDNGLFLSSNKDEGLLDYPELQSR